MPQFEDATPERPPRPELSLELIKIILYIQRRDYEAYGDWPAPARVAAELGIFSPAKHIPKD